MLLRRITAHIKAQNWFAVGLDFVIVVIGVFIGIQVANWNDARLRLENQQTYIERIREDLSANTEDFNQRIAYFAQVRTSGLRALAALDVPQDQLGVQFLVDVYQASQALPREMGRDTYDEILSASGSGAISDTALRKRLANFYSGMKASSHRLNYIPAYRETVREILPYHVQAAIRLACDDIITTGANSEPIIELPASCQPELSSKEISHAVHIVLEYDIRRDLNRLLSDLDNKQAASQLVLDRVELLDNFLEAYE